MPRHPRLFLPGAIYHVYCRVARGEFVFDDQDECVPNACLVHTCIIAPGTPDSGTSDPGTSDPGTAELQLGTAMANPGMAASGTAELQLGIVNPGRPSQTAGTTP